MSKYMKTELQKVIGHEATLYNDEQVLVPHSIIDDDEDTMIDQQLLQIYYHDIGEILF